MFSSKVIAAIRIIQELDQLFDKKEKGSSRWCALTSKELLEACAVAPFVFKSVLAILMKSKWIDTNSKGYYLLIAPSTLTLYGIYSLLHGGIPIGQAVDSRQHNTYSLSSKYKKLEDIETEITQQLTSQFKDIGFADMRTVPQ